MEKLIADLKASRVEERKARLDYDLAVREPNPFIHAAAEKYLAAIRKTNDLCRELKRMKNEMTKVIVSVLSQEEYIGFRSK